MYTGINRMLSEMVLIISYTGNTKAVILHLNANVLGGLLRRCGCVKCNYKDSRQGVGTMMKLSLCLIWMWQAKEEM